MNLHPLATSRLQSVEFGQFIVRLSSDIESLKLDLGKDPELLAQLTRLNEKSQVYDRHCSKSLHSRNHWNL